VLNLQEFFKELNQEILKNTGIEQSTYDRGE
jgi:hypothetical protein